MGHCLRNAAARSAQIWGYVCDPGICAELSYASFQSTESGGVIGAVPLSCRLLSQEVSARELKVREHHDGKSRTGKCDGSPCVVRWQQSLRPACLYTKPASSCCQNLAFGPPTIGPATATTDCGRASPKPAGTRSRWLQAVSLAPQETDTMLPPETSRHSACTRALASIQAAGPTQRAMPGIIPCFPWRRPAPDHLRSG